MENNNLAYNITKALGLNENGGKVDLNNLQAGKTGELKSIFQYTPDTWKAASGGLPLTPDNEIKVTLQRVQKWLDEGHSPEQIFSMWNAGAGEPDAYTGKFSTGRPSIGVNEKYGVRFNVPEYVKRGMKHLSEVQSSSTPQDNISTDLTPQENSPQVAIGQTSQPQLEQAPTSEGSQTPTEQRPIAPQALPVQEKFPLLSQLLLKKQTKGTRS